KKQGAFPPLAKLAKFGLSSGVGSGKQFFPWIHVEDAAAIFVHALYNTSVSGPYNAVSDEIITNKEFTLKLAKSVNRPVWLPNITHWFLRIVLGERAIALTSGLKISNSKIHTSNFKFKYSQIEETLKQLKL